MTKHENEFQNWKESTRQEALRKELERLQSASQKQNHSIRRMKEIIIASVFVLILSWGLFLFFLNQPPQNNDLSAGDSPKSPATADSITLNNNHLQKNQSTIEKLEIMTPDADTIEFYMPEDGIFFSIQIGAYLKVNLNQFRNNMVSLHQKGFGSINQFTLGIFPTYKEADEFRNIVKKIGFEDAYIIAVQNGHRIKIQDALNKRLQQDTAFHAP
jgi:hypothetical protein